MYPFEPFDPNFYLNSCIRNSWNDKPGHIIWVVKSLDSYVILMSFNFLEGCISHMMFWWVLSGGCSMTSMQQGRQYRRWLVVFQVVESDANFLRCINIGVLQLLVYYSVEADVWTIICVVVLAREGHQSQQLTSPRRSRGLNLSKRTLFHLDLETELTC
jgi:hypothetical protein